MDRILVSTVVHRPPAVVFPYLEAFTEYPKYTEHLTDVRRHGDGGAGTLYDLRLAWWKLTYTARSEVTSIEEPSSIEWRLVKDIDAEGEWRVERESSAALEDVEEASRVYFEAMYDPHSADEDAISLPRFVSLDWVIGKLEPKLLTEAERIVERLVADIEGEPRSVEFTVHEAP